MSKYFEHPSNIRCKRTLNHAQIQQIPRGAEKSWLSPFFNAPLKNNNNKKKAATRGYREINEPSDDPAICITAYGLCQTEGVGGTHVPYLMDFSRQEVLEGQTYHLIWRCLSGQMAGSVPSHCPWAAASHDGQGTAWQGRQGGVTQPWEQRCTISNSLHADN